MARVVPITAKRLAEVKRAGDLCQRSEYVCSRLIVDGTVTRDR
jgi:hypothetical protein